MARTGWLVLLALAAAAVTACRTAPTGTRAPDPLARGRALERSGRELAALDAYRGAIRATPGRLDVHLAYQDLALRRGERPLLVEEYRRASTGSERADRWLRVRLGTDAAARSELERLALGRDVVAGRAAVDLARRSRGEEALAAARRALSRLSDDPDATLALAAVLEALGRDEEALDAYDEALDRGAPAARGQAGRSRLLLRAGLPVAADRALQMVPPGERRGAEFQRARAEVAAALDRPVEVEAALERALEADPGDPVTRRRLGLLLVESGRSLERARFLLEPLAGPESEDVEVLVASGRLDLRAGEAEEAVGKLERAVTLGAGPEVRRDLLEAWVGAGRLEQAADAEVDGDGPALALRARARRALGRTGEAEADLRAALAADPDASDVAADLALLLAADGRSDEALALLRDRPATGATAAARGRILLDRGDAAGAERALREAVELGSDDPAVFLDLAELMRRRRSRGDRVRWLRAGLAASPDDAALAMALAEALGPTPEAEGLVRRLLRRRPPPPAARVLLARLLLRRGAVEEGIRLAIRAVEERPRDADARAAVGDAYAAAGRPDEAERSYDLALERDPACGGALRGRARLLARLGPERAKEALVAARAALDADPWSVETRMGLARLAQREDRPDETVAVLEPLVGEERPEPEALDLLARVQTARDESEEAIETLRRLLRLRRRDPGVHERLGRLYHALGRLGEAGYYYKQALRCGADEATIAPLLREVSEGR